MSLLAWIIAPLWILLGLAIYMLYSKSRAITTEDEILVLDERIQYDPSRYSVMVAVANPDNAVSLVQATYKICGAKNAQIELLHMVPVPDLLALSYAKKDITVGREGLTEAMLYLAMHFPISFTLRYCRNIARGIVYAIRQKKTQLLVMGWHGKPEGKLFNLGSTLDPVIDRSPCDVVVLKDCGRNQEFKNVLVPIAGGPNSAFALEMASILVDSDQGRITLLSVNTGQSTFDPAQWLENNRSRLQNDNIPIRTKVVKARSVTRAILSVSKRHDLVVIGTTKRPILAQLTRRPLPETIAMRCEKPVVITKTGGRIDSWLKRWI